MDAHFPHSGRSFVRVFFWGEEGAGREGGAPPSSGESKGEISKTRDERGPPPAGPSDGRKNITLEDAKRLRLQISMHKHKNFKLYHIRHVLSPPFRSAVALLKCPNPRS